jgi:hypothetical protein
MRPWPKGYAGRNHVTLGSDIAAVLISLEALVSAGGTRDALIAKVLGAEQLERLRELDPGAWYPIAWLLELMEKLDERVGRYGLLRMGRALFRRSHEERVRRIATCGYDVIHGIDGMYHHANRGHGIGGWHVVSFAEGSAELLKATPHHCAMEEGILAQALSAVGARAVVSQAECFRDGAPNCRFRIHSAGGNWAPKR